MKIPDSVSNLEASLTEPLGVALHAVRLAKMRLGDKVLVLGAGPIGLLAQQCASESGATALSVQPAAHVVKIPRIRHRMT